MNVCVDVQSAVTQRAGVGRYTRCLVQHLAPLARGGDCLRLSYFDFRRRGARFEARGAEWRAIRWISGRLAQACWKRFGAPAYDRLAGPADVYHFPNFIRPPLRRGRSVVTIHDVSFERYPEFAEARNLAYLRRHIRRTVREADHIITDSRFSAAEIEALLDVPGARITPIHLGVEPAFAPAPAARVAALRARLGLDRPYLLTVGTVEPRKNLPFLIEAFEALKDFDGLLVIAGMPGWKCAPIIERWQRSSRAAAIRHVAYVPDADLPALYTGAQAFVLASHYEGFGLPPLEAMACGIPVVSSTGGSLGEILGGAALRLDDFDVERWTDALRQAIGGSDVRRRLIAEGPRHAAGFSWAETARRTWQVYRSVCA